MNYTPANTFESYCTWALTKEKQGLDRRTRVDHGIIGVFGELGEFLDAIKKNFIYEQPLPFKNIKEELGDALFYLTILRQCNVATEEIRPVLAYEPSDSLDAAIDLIGHLGQVRNRLKAGAVATSNLKHILGLLQWLAHEYDITLVECYHANQEKLEIRYKDGYSNEAAAARADKAQEQGNAS